MATIQNFVKSLYLESSIFCSYNTFKVN